MKIAQVTKYFPPHKGGIESHVLGLSEGLSRLGHQVYVYTSNDPKVDEEYDLDNIKIFRSTVWFTLFNDPFAPGIFINLMKSDYDIVHIHMPDPFNSVFGYVASLLKKKPLFVTYHSDIIKDRWYHRLFRWVYSFFQGIILNKAVRIMPTTPNYVTGSQIPESVRWKIQVVPNFVDIDRFNPMLHGTRIREMHNIRKDQKMVLFLGRLVPYKGVEYLIEAFSKVVKECPETVLVIAGRGPLKEFLMEKVSDMKMSERILFAEPEEDDIPEYYAACDIFTLPSITRQEAFGIALLEAMASGKPVISTKISGMPYVVGDGGLLVKPKDVDELASALIKLLKDDKLRKELSVKARERVEKEFDQDLVSEKMLHVYESALREVDVEVKKKRK